MTKPKDNKTTIKITIKAPEKPLKIEFVSTVSIVNTDTGEELFSNPDFKTDEGWSKR